MPHKNGLIFRIPVSSSSWSAWQPETPMRPSGKRPAPCYKSSISKTNETLGSILLLPPTSIPASESIHYYLLTIILLPSDSSSLSTSDPTSRLNQLWSPGPLSLNSCAAGLPCKKTEYEKRIYTVTIFMLYDRSSYTKWNILYCACFPWWLEGE